MSPTRTAPRASAGPAPRRRWPAASRTGRSRPSRTCGSGRRRSRSGRDGADDDQARQQRRPSSRTRRSGAPSGACSRPPRGARTPPARRRPAGTVLGSVIMKNRKIRTSGEVTITRQKSKPQTGANAQFAVMQWPEPASRPIPTTSVIQKRRGQGEQLQPAGDQQPAADDRPRRPRSCRVERAPPEVERLDPGAAEHDERDDEADVRRVEHVRAAVPDDVLGQQREARDARRRPTRRRCSRARPDGVPTTRRIRATPLPVSIALAGQTNARLWRKVRAISMIAQVRIAARICGTLTRKRERDLAEDVDRDDHGRDMQPRVADVRQDQRVGVAADGDGSGGHAGSVTDRTRRIIGAV